MNLEGFIDVPLVRINGHVNLTNHLKCLETTCYSIGQKGIIHSKDNVICPFAYDHVKHIRSPVLKLRQIHDPDALVKENPKLFQKCKSCFCKKQAWKELQWTRQETCRPFYLSKAGVDTLKQFRQYHLHAAFYYGNYNFCYCGYYYSVVSCKIREVDNNSQDVDNSCAWGDGIQVKCDTCGKTGWTHWQHLYKLLLLTTNPETGFTQEVVVFKNPDNRPDIWF